jgi:hypothetical protein
MMRNEKGLTVVEALLAGFVLVIGAMGMATVIGDVLVLSTSTENTNLAVQAARSKMDELQSACAFDFSRVYIDYNADVNDDRDGPGSGPGNLFDVEGLEPADGKTHVGEIIFFINEVVAVKELGLINKESENDEDEGDRGQEGAIDIDGNKNFNETDDKVTDPWSPDPPSHQILPVRILITWKDAMDGSDRTYEMESILYQR